MDPGTFYYTDQNAQVPCQPGRLCGKDFEDNEQIRYLILAYQVQRKLEQ